VRISSQGPSPRARRALPGELVRDRRRGTSRRVRPRERRDEVTDKIARVCALRLARGRGHEAAASRTINRSARHAASLRPGALAIMGEWCLIEVAGCELRK
jgi:hypothetical protein